MEGSKAKRIRSGSKTKQVESNFQLVNTRFVMYVYTYQFSLFFSVKCNFKSYGGAVLNKLNHISPNSLVLQLTDIKCNTITTYCLNKTQNNARLL